MTVLVMVTAVQSPGLVMVLLTVKIKPGAVTLPAMIMMVVTAKAVVELPVVAVKTVMTANMILHLTAVNAVIQPGMNMALIVPHLKAATTGIVPAVTVQVMGIQSVAMVHVMVMKPMKLVQKIVTRQVNVMMVM